MVWIPSFLCYHFEVAILSTTNYQIGGYIIMKNRNVNLQELRQKMKDLQEQIDSKEKEINMEVGAWVRKQTKLDSLHEIQQNFRLVSVNNNAPKTLINTQTTALSSADMTPKSAC